ncbi:acyl carrier protein [Chitinilyticum piscinae]|uniref:Acyl carrier protein n=1 Tax=Chitinilyticum piscinae TaxID=2866724 RepID=A0A8J7FF10_9NEIS|nr:acyl carrier protein [Chitinilyticum piscinae]MBE9607825.1 acyl carrier protein [Chitinilyticum piscinae]
MDKQTVQNEIVRIMGELFELPAERIVPEARLYDDLEIDSIDAVDLAAELRDLVGRKISPEDFKQVRTVADLVDAVLKQQQ